MYDASLPLTTFPIMTPSQRKRGMAVLYLNTFFILLGYTTIFSVIALHYTRDLRFTAAGVGIALAIRQLAQQGFDIFGGIFAERFGYRLSISLGCAIRSCAFVGIAFAQSLPQLIAAAFIAGFGGMFFDAAGSGALANIAIPEKRAQIFAIQATIISVGAALGPILGILLYTHVNFAAVGCMGAAVFGWISIQTFFWLPDHIEQQVQSASHELMNLSTTLQAIRRRPNYVRIVLLQVGFWIVAIQLSLTVPLVGTRLSGLSGVAFLLGLNSFLAIPLQYPLVRFMERHFTSTQLLGGSMALTALGMVIIFNAPTFGWQVAGIVVITIGSLSVGPIIAALTAQVAPPGATAVFYGFTALGMGFGGAIGQYVGGRIYDLQTATNMTWLLSVFVAIVGLVITIFMFRTKSPTLVVSAQRTPVVTADQSLAAQSGIMQIPR